MVAGAVHAYAAVLMKLEVANLRTEVAQQLNTARAEMQKYMNGSFMRASEVRTMYSGIKDRMDKHESTCHPIPPIAPKVDLP